MSRRNSNPALPASADGKHAFHHSGSRSARTRACRVHTHVNAKLVSSKPVFAGVRALPLCSEAVTPTFVRTRPRVIFNARNQSRLYRILLNVLGDPVPFVFISHPMIEGFAPPKLIAGASEQLVRLPRCKSFERFEQLARRYQRQQKGVDVISHDRKRTKLVVAEVRAPEQRIDHHLGDFILREEYRTIASFIQVAVHPGERFAWSALAGWSELTAWQAAVEMPGDEEPTVVGIDARKPAAGVHLKISGIPLDKVSRFVAHALMRAVFALLRTRVGTKLAQRSHECERGAHECVRHGAKAGTRGHAE